MRGGGFLTNFDLHGNVMKTYYECLIYRLNQNLNKRENKEIKL